MSSDWWSNEYMRPIPGDTNHLIPVIIQVVGQAAYMEAYNSRCMFRIPLPPGEWAIASHKESIWLREAPDAHE